MPVKPKVYVLLPHTYASIPIFQRVNNEERVKIEKRPLDAAFLQITCTPQPPDDNTPPRNRTLRLKLNSDSIWLDEQVKEGLPAHVVNRDGSLGSVAFTNQERDAVKFINGQLVARYEIVQKFLDAHPQNKKFKGLCDQIKHPLFEELNKEALIDEDIDDFDRRLAAANRIGAIHDLKEAQEMMIRLNGFYFKPPETLRECKQGLIAFLDDANDAALAKIMQDSLSIDEEIAISVGKAVNKGILSFTDIPNQVAIKSGSGWKPARMSSSEIAMGERQRLFVEFLGTPEGMILFKDIQNKLGEPVIEKKKKEKAEA